ncbi:MAG: hypothetical protein ACON41_07665 [Parvibaculales bacterium]
MIAQRFHLDATLQYILQQARLNKFTSFKQLTRFYGIADQDWAHVYTLLFQHINKLVFHCAENQIPCLAVMVVSKIHIETGIMSNRQVARLSKVMLAAHYQGVMSLRNLQNHQKHCFSWVQKQENDFYPIEVKNGEILPLYERTHPLGANIYKLNS